MTNKLVVIINSLKVPDSRPEFLMAIMTLEQAPLRVLVFPCHSRSTHTAPQWRTEGGGVGVFKLPHPEIPKALQNSAKLNPIVKTIKNC